MPSYSTGFWVATTRNGSGSGCGVALDRHLALLHRLEQRGLGLGRRAVDLVGQQQVGEHRSLAEAEPARLLVEDDLADHVRRHEVGGELHPLELEVERGGERLDQQRLGRRPGTPSSSTWPRSNERGDQSRQRALLADDDLAHLVAQRQNRLARIASWIGHRTSLRMASTRGQLDQGALVGDRLAEHGEHGTRWDAAAALTVASSVSTSVPAREPKWFARS